MKTAREMADATRAKREGREYRGDCPVHGGRSFCFREKGGRLVFVCRAGCSQGDVISALKKMGLWGDGAGQEIPPPPEPDPSELERKADRASDLWNEAHPIKRGDPVWLYLQGRGIVLPEYPENLRTHPNLGYWEVNEVGKPVKTGTFPAMLAVVRSPIGQPVGIHRTWVSPDGSGKAPVPSPKKILKVFNLTGGAVRLFPPRDGLLAVCEGIEDGLSSWVLWRIPAWACLGTSGMKAFEPPEGIKELIVFADRDENGAGQKAALELAERMEEKGKAVRIRIPSGHKDINGLLKGACK